MPSLRVLLTPRRTSPADPTVTAPGPPVDDRTPPVGKSQLRGRRSIRAIGATTRATQGRRSRTYRLSSKELLLRTEATKRDDTAAHRMMP